MAEAILPVVCKAQSPFPFWSPTVAGSDGAGATCADRETLSAVVVWTPRSVIVEDETGRCMDAEDEACTGRERGGSATNRRIDRISGSIILLNLKSLRAKKISCLPHSVWLKRLTEDTPVIVP